MTFDFHIIIPARFQSSRLPGKLMMEISGKTVIERVYHQALQAGAKSIVIATDHSQLAEHARGFGAHVVMTSESHPTGTDRLAEVIQKGNYASRDIIVNLQGDEPFISPDLIRQAAQMLHGSDAPVATLCWPVETYEQLINPNVVKVVRDKSNQALYFSRAAIPAHRDDPHSIQLAFRHVGLYAYRADFLLEYVNLPATDLEKCEMLEQLRILWAGYKIRVDEACTLPKQDINTSEDLHLAQALC